VVSIGLHSSEVLKLQDAELHVQLRHARNRRITSLMKFTS